jgi:hypothetical protein
MDGSTSRRSRNFSRTASPPAIAVRPAPSRHVFWAALLAVAVFATGSHADSGVRGDGGDAGRVPRSARSVDGDQAPRWERLLGDFEDGWRDAWREKELDGRTVYDVRAADGSDRYLRAVSRGGASGLWRMLDIEPGQAGLIRWRWRIEEALRSDRSERERRGDDYAARVMVIFEPRFPEFRTRAIAYVWARHEPEGAVYPSPYAANVATYVLESGEGLAGTWVHEERDFVADYRAFFSREPEQVSGVAILVDTDNTDSQAVSWFDDLELYVP